MKKALIIIGIIFVIIVLTPLLFPGQYVVERKIHIKADKEWVFTKVADFHQWQMWSPWLVMEPDAKLNFYNNAKMVGSKYDWKGELTGEGEMTITDIKGMEHIDYDLRFMKPFKSEADVYMNITEKDEGVEVLWGMKGSMPYFFRFLNGSMDGMIGMDYTRGLTMLKDLCEDSVVYSRVEYGKPEDFKALHYIGISREDKFNDMEAKMIQSIELLQTYLQKNNLESQGPIFNIYTKMDFTEGKAIYTTAIPVEIEEPANLEEPFVYGTLPAQKVFPVTHYGDYHHLGNAWSSAIQYTRVHKLKPQLQSTTWEMYINNPAEQDSPDNYISVVYLPLKD